MKFLSFGQFNESSMSDIFRSAHAAINPDDLVPLTDLIGNNKFPSKEEFDEAVEYLNIDPQYLFYNPKDFLTPIIYWNGPVFYGFHGGLNMEAIKMLRTKEAIAQVTKFMDEQLKKKDYDSIFSRAEKKILIPTFIKMFDDIPDNQKYDVFTDLYVRSEYGFNMFPKNIIDKCFSLRKLSNDWKKRMEVFNKVAKLDDGNLTIYRGENVESAKAENAYSWTLNQKTAKFFADRFNKGQGKIIRRKIKPENVIDYIDNRGESEIIVNPSKDLFLPI